jgi:hypothetical protein
MLEEATMRIVGIMLGSQMLELLNTKQEQQPFTRYI